MADKVPVIVDPIPNAVVAGSPEDLGGVDLNTLARVADNPGDSEAVAELATELYNLVRGLEIGRIGIIPREF